MTQSPKKKKKFFYSEFTEKSALRRRKERKTGEGRMTQFILWPHESTNSFILWQDSLFLVPFLICCVGKLTGCGLSGCVTVTHAII